MSTGPDSGADGSTADSSAEVDESTEGHEVTPGGSTRTVRPRRRPRGATIAGLCFVLAGLVLLGWVGYQFVGTNVVAQSEFESQRSQLREQWAGRAPGAQSSPDANNPTATATPAPVELGDAVALMRIPRFGEDYEVPLVQGTTPEVLTRGVGIYDSSVAPGEVGNFAIAGHRITQGEPFRRLLDLQVGDTVIIETADAIFTYVMDTSPADLTVHETANWVLEPVPGEPDATPTRALLTMTTCQDLFRSPDRSVGFGHLEKVQNKTQ
ncbi:class E sortase [Propionibacteriaceae bacterium Y2011]